MVIERPADGMHVRALQDSVVLQAALKDSVAVTLTWDWPELSYGATSYDYALKLDVAGNNQQTSIPKMALAGDNTVSFTHKQLNDWLEKWGVTPGQFTGLEVEIIATPRGTDHYVKPMLSTAVFSICGYTSILYLAGSATQVGTDYASALDMQKVAGEEAYTWEGLLRQGELNFLSDRAAEAMVDTKTIARDGWYRVRYDLASGELSLTEPLYMIGDATDAGWSMSAAVELTNETPSRLTWSGVLSEGELKFVSHPQSGDWWEPFYVSALPDAVAEGTWPILMRTSEEVDDYKWLVAEAGIYTITVDLEAATVTFGRDHSMDDLPVKSVWLCGSATPGGWNTPFPEKMHYDFSAPRGTFVWEGQLVAGEMKLPLNASQYEGAFYLADDFDMALTPGVTYHLNYFASCDGVEDKKWVITEAGHYKVVVNVVDETLKIQKQ